MKVLVVDDDEGVRELIACILDEGGHEAVLVNSGIEGLTILAGEQFDVVITDIRMPGMSGIELIRQIRTHPATAIRLLFIIAMGGVAADLVGARVADADVVMEKPFRYADLVAAVNGAASSPRPH